MPPSLVTHFQIRLNLNNPEDAEIYANLEKHPGGARSKLVKTALLLYFRERNGGDEKRTPAKPKSKPLAADTEKRTSAEKKVPSVPPVLEPEKAPDTEAEHFQESTTTTESSERIKDMLGMLQ